MTTKIDWTQPIETTDGRPAKVLSYEPRNSDRRFVIIPRDWGDAIYVVDADGQAESNADIDFRIRNVRREPREIYVNHYPSRRNDTVHDYKVDGVDAAGNDAVCVAVHYREVIEE